MINHVIKTAPLTHRVEDEAPTQRRKTSSRAVVVETVYHHQQDGQATPIESRYAKLLKTDEQLYTRQLKVGQEWVALDGVWLAEASMVLVRNERYMTGSDGSILQVNPTQEQEAEADSRVVEVVCVAGTPARDKTRDMFSPPVPEVLMPAPWLVYPGESMRATPSDLSSVRIRCRSGVARVVVNVIPS